METGTTTAGAFAPEIQMPAWKTILGHLAAVIIGILFLGAGAWKALDPLTWSKNLEAFKVSYQLSLPATLLLSTTEIFGGIMIFVPKLRRWGSIVTTMLLLMFTGYFAIHYTDFKGMDCTCFPGVSWLQRSVGPEFFITESAMILAAVLAGIWARPSAAQATPTKAAAMILGAAVAFSGISYAAAASKQSGIKAPETVTVDGKPYSIQKGDVLLFFYNPTCPYCENAAKALSTQHWKPGVDVVSIPTTDPQFAADFLHDTHLQAKTATDVAALRKVFAFGDPPWAAALHDGRMIGAVPHFEEAEPQATLKKYGFVE